MHLRDILSPLELLHYGPSDDLPEDECKKDRDAVEPFAVVAYLMLGGDTELFAGYMTALTGIERALRRKSAVPQ